MKKIIYSILTCFIIVGILASCENDPESKKVGEPVGKSKEYLEALRAYKKSEHQIAFGWFGGWNPDAASVANTLKSVPDSVDIISIWGNYLNLKESQFKDMQYVQKMYGTRVTYTIFAHEVPAPFDATTEGVGQYAKALADTMTKYGYDGIDLDYEPGWGGHGPLVNPTASGATPVAPVPLMTDFVKALGKYFGPKSGTDKLLLIDGVPYQVDPSVADYFDYGIVQAYNSSGDTDLQTRFNYARNRNWEEGQYVFAEDFEAYWATGGRVNYRHVTADGVTMTVPSLIGMALFEPTIAGERKVKGGAGTYHMENEYKHTPDYKYLREAIQTMNPSKAK